MLTDDPGQEDRVARLRQPQATSNNAQNSLAKFAKTDFGHLRASLKLRDAAIGVVVVGVVFCLGNLDFNRYQFQPFLNWMIWLLLLSLPSVCMIFLPLWLSRKRRANLVHWPGIRSILVEAAIAAPLTLLIILFDHLLGIDDSEIRRAWEWVILRPDLRMVFVMIVPFMVVIGPVAEELFYRAFLYNALRSRLPAVIAATAQAALFAIPHFYGLALTTVLFTHGLCLLGIYLWRKTLLTPIFVHVFRNLTFVILLLATAASYPYTAHLGVGIDSHEEGCLVLEVMAGSAADKAGLRDGDIITSIDDQPVESREGLVGLIQSRQVGDHVAITVIRNGKQLELQAVLGRRVDRTANSFHEESLPISKQSLEPYKAIYEINRARIGFTALPTTGTVKVVTIQRNTWAMEFPPPRYDVMLNFCDDPPGYRRISHRVGMRMMAGKYQWIFEQQFFDGPKKYTTGNGTTFNEHIKLSCETEQVSSVGAESVDMSVTYSGPDPRLIGETRGTWTDQLTIWEVAPILKEWGYKYDIAKARQKNSTDKK